MAVLKEGTTVNGSPVITEDTLITLLPGSQPTFATTSAYDATSATAAPLKSAGGLAVAGNAWIAKNARINHTNIADVGDVSTGEKVDAGKTRRVLFTFPESTIISGQVSVSITYGGVSPAEGAAWQLYGRLATDAASFGVYQIFKVEVPWYGTMGNPTWASPTTFYIDITNTNAQSTIYYFVQALFTSGSPVTITTSTP